MSLQYKYKGMTIELKDGSSPILVDLTVFDQSGAIIFHELDVDNWEAYGKGQDEIDKALSSESPQAIE